MPNSRIKMFFCFVFLVYYYAPKVLKVYLLQQCFFVSINRLLTYIVNYVCLLINCMVVQHFTFPGINVSVLEGK